MKHTAEHDKEITRIIRQAVSTALMAPKLQDVNELPSLVAGALAQACAEVALADLTVAAAAKGEKVDEDEAIPKILSLLSKNAIQSLSRILDIEMRVAVGRGNIFDEDEDEESPLRDLPGMGGAH